MVKHILTLKGIQKLSKSKQRTINGGLYNAPPEATVPCHIIKWCNSPLNDHPYPCGMTVNPNANPETCSM